MAKRHARHPVTSEQMRTPLLYMPRKERVQVLDAIVDELLREDAVVVSYSRSTGRGRLVSASGREYVFTAKRKYLRVGIGVSFLGGRTRAYCVRRERLIVLDGARD
jgi:hypothetical protein